MNFCCLNIMNKINGKWYSQTMSFDDRHIVLHNANMLATNFGHFSQLATLAPVQKYKCKFWTVTDVQKKTPKPK